MPELVLSVSDFVAVFNQTLEYAYPSVSIEGELANFRVSKNRWVYFDLKDEQSSVKFFATIYQLPGPLEDGLMLRVSGQPRLHSLFGFSVNVQTIQPVGQGSIKKAAALLETKLAAEGLFDLARKRLLPYPPTRIGLITSGESAAYHDFIKIINQRWMGIEISFIDVQVQGQAAPTQIVQAIEHFNQMPALPDVLIITRGGGSAEDLAAFNAEALVRAVAGSRIPTLVAIGHEVDESLAELAADQRASTPSNAAELLVPDKKRTRIELISYRQVLAQHLHQGLKNVQQDLNLKTKSLDDSWQQYTKELNHTLSLQRQILTALNPAAILRRGYAIVRKGGKAVRSGKQLATGQKVYLELSDANAAAIINKVTVK